VRGKIPHCLSDAQIHLALPVLLVTSDYQTMSNGKAPWSIYRIYMLAISARDQTSTVRTCSTTLSLSRSERLLITVVPMFINMQRRTTIVATLVVALAAVIIPTATARSFPASYSRILRIGRPCAGRNATAVAAADNDDRRQPSITAEDNVVSRRHRLRRSVRNIKRLLDDLYDDVHRLKTEYVSF